MTILLYPLFPYPSQRDDERRSTHSHARTFGRTGLFVCFRNRYRESASTLCASRSNVICSHGCAGIDWMVRTHNSARAENQRFPRITVLYVLCIQAIALRDVSALRHRSQAICRQCWRERKQLVLCIEVNTNYCDNNNQSIK